MSIHVLDGAGYDERADERAGTREEMGMSQDGGNISLCGYYEDDVQYYAGGVFTGDEGQKTSYRPEESTLDTMPLARRSSTGGNDELLHKRPADFFLLPSARS